MIFPLGHIWSPVLLSEKRHFIEDFSTGLNLHVVFLSTENKKAFESSVAIFYELGKNASAYPPKILPLSVLINVRVLGFIVAFAS